MADKVEVEKWSLTVLELIEMVSHIVVILRRWAEQFSWKISAR